MKNKFLALAVLLSLMIMVVSGCGTKKDSSEVDDSNAKQTVKNKEESSTEKESSDKDKNVGTKNEEDKKTEVEKETEEEPQNDSENGESQISVEWAEDALDRYETYHEFTADSSEAQVRVLFSTNNKVEDFKVISVMFNDTDESGRIKVDKEEIYSLDTLEPEKPLVVTLTFFGDLPSYGISYVDNKGNTRIYYLGMSGKDGSLMLIDSENV